MTIRGRCASSPRTRGSPPGSATTARRCSGRARFAPRSAPALLDHPCDRAHDVVEREGEERRADQRPELILRRWGAGGGRRRDAIGEGLAPADEAGLAELLRIWHTTGLPAAAGGKPRPAPRRDGGAP